MDFRTMFDHDFARVEGYTARGGFVLVRKWGMRSPI